MYGKKGLKNGKFSIENTKLVIRNEFRITKLFGIFRKFNRKYRKCNQNILGIDKSDEKIILWTKITVIGFY